MDHLLVLQSNGILKNANSYILTNREKRELIDAYNSLSKMDKNIVAFMPRDTFERLYKDKLLQKVKENRDSFTGDLIQLFIDSDPTENHKYIEWLATGYLNNGIRRLEDLKSRALPALRDFILLSNKNVLNRGDPTQPWTDQYNINNFLGLSGGIKKGKQFLGLDSLIDSYQTQLNQIKGVKEQQLQVMKESELVFENELVKVYQPKSEEAACRLGAGTKWCTAARENNMFERYSKKGDIKIIVPKSPNYTGEKYQFHHETESYMNERDEPVNPLELFDKYKMYDEIKKIKILKINKDFDISKEYIQLLQKYPEIEKNIDIIIVDVFPEWIFTLKNITDLSLIGEVSFTLPKEIGNFKELKSLSTKDIYLSELPKEIGNLTNLTSLVIINSNLTKLPKEIGNLTNLTSLNFNFNLLTELPKKIGNLINLIYFNVSNNKLTKLPKEIGNLINLDTFSIYNNEVTELPKEIGNLTNLTYLSASKNKLTKLPKEIGNLTNLIEFNVSDNKLTELPKEIGNLKNLDSLDISNNSESLQIPAEIEKLNLNYFVRN